MNWFIKALKSYATFQGRARRKEFWFFTLFYIIIAIVAIVVDGLIGFPILSIVTFLGLIVPSIAVSIRRLHDIGRSGWWYLISLIPLGFIVLIVFFCLASEPESNAHGPNPINDVKA